MHYANEDEAFFAQSVYNSTINIVDSIEPFDVFSFVKSFSLTAFLVAGAFFAYNGGKFTLAGSKKSGKKSAAATPAQEQGTKKSAEGKEWLENKVQTPTK